MVSDTPGLLEEPIKYIWNIPVSDKFLWIPAPLKASRRCLPKVLARHGKRPTVSRLLTCSLLPPLNDPQTAPGPPPRPEPAQIVRADKVRRVQFAFRSQMLVAKQLESPLLLIGCDSAVDNTSLSKVELYYRVSQKKRTFRTEAASSAALAPVREAAHLQPRR